MRLSQKQDIADLLKDVQEVMPQVQNAGDLEKRIEDQLDRLETFQLDNTEVNALSKEDLERFFEDPKTAQRVSDDMLEKLAEATGEALRYDAFWEILDEVVRQHKDEILSTDN